MTTVYCVSTPYQTKYAPSKAAALAVALCWLEATKLHKSEIKIVRESFLVTASREDACALLNWDGPAMEEEINW